MIVDRKLEHLLFHQISDRWKLPDNVVEPFIGPYDRKDVLTAFWTLVDEKFIIYDGTYVRRNETSHCICEGAPE